MDLKVIIDGKSLAAVGFIILVAKLDKSDVKDVAIHAINSAKEHLALS